MAANGTTVQTRTADLLTVTWTVTSSAAAGDTSAAIDFTGYAVVDWYMSAATDYVGGDFKIGLLLEADNDGLIDESAGRHKRSNKSTTTLNEAGYLLYPPPSAFLTVGNHDGLSTAYTVTLYARPFLGAGSSTTAILRNRYVRRR